MCIITRDSLIRLPSGLSVFSCASFRFPWYRSGAHGGNLPAVAHSSVRHVTAGCAARCHLLGSRSQALELDRARPGASLRPIGAAESTSTIRGQLFQIGDKGHHEPPNMIHVIVAVRRLVPMVKAVQVTEQAFRGKASAAESAAGAAATAVAIALGALVRCGLSLELAPGRLRTVMPPKMPCASRY